MSAYLDALVWDKRPRIDRWLIDYAGASDTPYVRASSRFMLIAAVRRARQPGCQIDEILILEGLQGSGKSSALRILAGCDDWFSADVQPRTPAKKLIAATAGKWIVELSELQRMGAGDVEALKAFVSSPVDIVRPAYQRQAVRIPRQFVIVGTTSEAEYLHDLSGNRRFWPVHVERFDLDRLRHVRDQLWAEAAVLEASGALVWVLSAEAAREEVTPASLSPRAVGAITSTGGDPDRQEGSAYVVIGDQFGVEFSSLSLDAACTYVGKRLREQALETTLLNPSSYRIKQVKAG